LDDNRIVIALGFQGPQATDVLLSITPAKAK